MNKIVVIFILILSTSSFSKEKLKVAFGDALPPWVLKEQNRGIIYDILTECLSGKNITVIPKYLPYSRRIKSYLNNEVDAVIDINPEVIKKHSLKGFNSEVAYVYVNYFISLKEKKFKFKTINDLLGVSLLSWQDAIIHLGGDYAIMAKKHRDYTETHNQEAQVKMLFSKRVDVVQMDFQIFNYYRELNLENELFDVKQEVTIHKLLGESPNSILFRSEKVYNHFSKNLEKIKRNGVYEKIINKYSKW